MRVEGSGFRVSGLGVGGYGLGVRFYARGASQPSSASLGLTDFSKAGSYLRLIDSCITQLKDQGPSRTCNESKEEEKEETCYESAFPSPGRTGAALRVRSLRAAGCYSEREDLY